MRWDLLRRSRNVEDRRDGSAVDFTTDESAARPRPRAGLGGGVKVGGGSLLLALVLGLVMGKNPLELLSMLQQPSTVTQSPRGSAQQQRTGAPDQMSDFVRAILGDTEDTWERIFQQLNGQYSRPKLVLFNRSVQSACGHANAAMGPFYCPGDAHVYLDLSFFHELSQRFGAPGDFARAYVIAHEIGHHVQNLMGVSSKVHQQQMRMSPEDGNVLSVRQELQADCFAGVWGHYAYQRKLLEPGDLEEALRAATAIGDDRLQMQAQGYVVPESFTHGTSAQRLHWFRSGLQSGDVRQCNTFTTQTP